MNKLIDPFAAAEGPPPHSLWPFMRWALRGSWPALGLATFISALAGLMEAATALIMGLVIDSTAARSPEAYFTGETLVVLAASVAFFMVLRPLAFGLSSAANSILVAPNVNPLVLSRLNRWTLGQAVQFFDNDFAGRIAQKQMQTARALTDVVVEVINVVAFALASLLGSVLLLVAIDGTVALAFLLWLVAYFVAICWYLPRIRERAAARAGARAHVSGQIVDTITNIKTVKLFAHDAHEDRAALGALGQFRQTALHFGRLAAGFRFVLMGLAGVLPVLLIGIALHDWSLGQASAGDIVAAGTVSIRIAQMTGWVSFTLMTIYSNIGEVEDGMRTLTPRIRLEDAPDAQPLRLNDGQSDIVFQDVSFAYGQAAGGVDSISLAIKSGEKLAIVGASGAGKSTLVSLVLRLHQPEGGQIAIAGQDIQSITQQSLRRAIGMVTQETAMFNRSVRDNIAYGRPDASDAEIQQAARKAEAHDFIISMQDHKGRRGYDAHLGERGVKLSGGQRQRIALARAILKDAPILVLDEATSALDSEVEAAIQTALERVMQGKTVLAIAHRLSTIARMDRIVVMDQGRIVEQGTHDQLLAKSGLYARYWQRQSGGFMGLDAAE
jgi:ATP-binding cassette subfamily B protein